MFQNIVSLIERVDDAASELSGAPHSSSLTTEHREQYDPHPNEIDSHTAAPIESPKLRPAASHSSSQLYEGTPLLAGSTRGLEPSSTYVNSSEQDQRLIDVQHRMAVAECSKVLETAEIGALRLEMSQVRLQYELRQQLLLRLSLSVRNLLVTTGTNNDTLDQLCSEVDAVVGSQLHTSASSKNAAAGRDNEPSVDPVSTAERLESLLRIQQAKLDAMSECNIELRKRLSEEEATHQNEKESWSSQWGALSAQAERSQHLLREVERRKEEALHAWTKMSSMQTALRQSTDRCRDVEQQLGAVQNVLLIRDEELSISRAEVDKLRLGIDVTSTTIPVVAGGTTISSVSGSGGSAAPHFVSNSKLLRSIAAKHKYGPVVHRGLSAVDGVVFACVRVLARQAWLRLFIALYIVVLHIHMFHIVSIVVHAGLPHEVGDDVHDHIKNHLVK